MMIRLVVFLVLWIGSGLVTALIMRHRGHDLPLWAALGVVFGPLSVPLAVWQVRREPLARPRLLTSGEGGGGHLDVLVGVDGSEEAARTARDIASRMGPALGRLTLAAVIDTDTSVSASVSLADPAGCEAWGEQWPHEEQARSHLAAVRSQLTGYGPATVILGGDPAAALGRYALEEGYDFVVVGPRGRGASETILGSVASHLARGSLVPVVIGPRGAPTPPAGSWSTLTTHRSPIGQ